MLSKCITRIGIVFLLFVFAACNSSSSSTPTTGPTTKSKVTVTLTDNPIESCQAVYVSIARVDVHVAESPEDDGWVTVATPEATYDLIALTNGVKQTLGVTDLDTGDYTQMRLILSSTADSGTNTAGEAHPFPQYVIDLAGDAHELTVPSGYQSGIKIVGGFTITEGEDTELMLDFDASQSVHQAGKSGKWMLKPVIRMIKGNTGGSISGTVINGEEEPVAGAHVSAYAVGAGPSTDATVSGEVVGAAITDANGMYAITVTAGTYNLAVFEPFYTIPCDQITVAASENTTRDYTLSMATTGTLLGDVSFAGLGDDDDVSLIVYGSLSCQAASQDTVEITRIQLLDNQSYTLELPVGSYQVGYQMNDTASNLTPVTITEGGNTEFDVTISQ